MQTTSLFNECTVSAFKLLTIQDGHTCCSYDLRPLIQKYRDNKHELFHLLARQTIQNSKDANLQQLRDIFVISQDIEDALSAPERYGIVQNLMSIHQNLLHAIQEVLRTTIVAEKFRLNLELFNFAQRNIAKDKVAFITEFFHLSQDAIQFASFILPYLKINSEIKHEIYNRLKLMSQLINSTPTNMCVPINTVARFMQIHDHLIDPFFEKQPYQLNKFKIFEIAASIESIKLMDCVNNAYFHAGTRSLQLDTAQKVIFIISNAEVSTLSATGSTKKVVNALSIPLDIRHNNIQKVVQALPYGEINSIDLKCITNEIDLLYKLKALSGIVKIISVAHIANSSVGLIPSIILEKADSITPKDLLSDSHIPLNKKIQTIYEIIVATNALHKMNICHADLKEQNFIFVQGRVKIIDLNLSFSMHTKHTRMIKDSGSYLLFKHALYPASWYTPSEMLSNQPGQYFKNKYRKIETFVIGCMLFRTLFSRTHKLPWIERVISSAAINQGLPLLSETDKARILIEHNNHIEQPLQSILENRKASNALLSNRIRYMLYNLMRMDPDQRHTLGQAKNYLETHCGEFLTGNF